MLLQFLRITPRDAELTDFRLIADNRELESKQMLDPFSTLNFNLPLIVPTQLECCDTLDLSSAKKGGNVMTFVLIF